MKILIVYSSTEGQTRKIADYAYERLSEAGHSVAHLSAADAPVLDLLERDAILLASSVHGGVYQKEMREFVVSNAEALSRAKTLFLSVSLAAAGDDEDDWIGIRNVVKAFCEETGWMPDRVEHVAGAFRFTEYDFLKYWAMRWIEAKRDSSAKPGTDKEYTDWDALAAILKEWAGEVEAS